MTKIRDIYEDLQRLAPEYMAEDWDHVGLLCGHFDRDVKRVLVALDPALPVCREASEKGCQLIVTHHPVLWNLKAVNDGNEEGKRLLYMIEHGIAALNAHTNLDKAPGGVNDCLARLLGLRNVVVIDPEGKDAEGRPYGLLRGGETDPMSPAELAQKVKEVLKCDGLRYTEGSHEIRRVAVGGGACSEFTSRVAELGYDAFVTADCKYHGFADAKAMGFTLVDAGHFQTENPVCTCLAERLRKNFPDLEVFLSDVHEDSIKFA